jgi:tetratricopeptide (TPR) repeat protein
MKPATVLTVFFLLLPIARGQQPVADGPDEFQDMERIRNTLAYRIEEARELGEEGKLREADAVYDDLLTLFEAAGPLAAQTWLRAAALKVQLDEKERAIELYLDVLDRFSHIPWATLEAKGQLDKLGAQDVAGVRPDKQSKAYKLKIRDRVISVNFKEAKLADVQAVFKQAFRISLDIDPALADKPVTVRAENIAAYDALAMIAGKIGAKLESKATGYRLVAATRPVKRLAVAPKKEMMTRMGHLTRGEIAKVVRANLRGVQFCYEKNLLVNPGLTGKLVLSWTIDTDGTVRDAELKTDTLGNPGVGKCLLAEILKWKFPKPRGGGVVKVTYPFIFNSIGF